MKLMLTSFGIERTLGAGDEPRSFFHRMPPVSFRWFKDTFMPDYDLLLLCDEPIMDESSFRQLTEEPSHAYAKVADTFRELKTEGRIQLVDFGSILRANVQLLDRMTDHDIRILDQWVNALRDSIIMWRHFSEKSIEVWGELDEVRLYVHDHYRDAHPRHEIRDYQRTGALLTHEIGGHFHYERDRLEILTCMVDEALKSSAKRREKEHREALRETLKGYLSYVNANLILSNELQVGFHDWLDFTPFYAAKFLSVGKETDSTQEERKQVETLFTIPFPELAIKDTRSLVKALNDKRIGELRQLVGDAVAGKVEFDHEFAKSVLRQVLGAEATARKWRSIIGYLTMPLGIIPWIGSVADKAASETLGAVADRRIKTAHQWFYMLSEIAESSRKVAEPESPGDADEPPA